MVHCVAYLAGAKVTVSDHACYTKELLSHLDHHKTTRGVSREGLRGLEHPLAYLTSLKYYLSPIISYLYLCFDDSVYKILVLCQRKDEAQKHQWRIQDLRKGVSKFVGEAHMAAIGSCRVSGPC